MQPTNLKEQQAKDVYNKVFAGQDKQRNPCSVAICCKVFFTKTNKPTQQTHIEVITLSEFKKKFGVRTETEFLLWARDCTSPQGVRLNAQDCAHLPQRPTYAEQVAFLQNEVDQHTKLLNYEVHFSHSLPVCSLYLDHHDRQAQMPKMLQVHRLSLDSKPATVIMNVETNHK